MDAVELVRRRFTEAWERHRMRPPNGRVLVACSGGPDSRTLLDALSRPDLDLYVAAVDHGLRPEAALEAAAVVASAAGLPATVLRVTVEPHTMAAARQARYRALIAHAQQIGAGAIAVGHTATDQAETLLDRMLRGTGLGGLSAMAPVRACAPGLSLVRPMLGITRDEVEAYVTARGLSVVRDPTNVDRAYRRSRIRHEVMPLLRRERADADRAMAELCERLREDAEALDQVAATEETGDVVRLRVMPPALRARVFLRRCPAPLESVHLEALARLVSTSAGTQRLNLPGGVVAERAYGQLTFGPPKLDPGDVVLRIEGPGEYELLGVRLSVVVSGPSVLRNLRPGDRVRGGKKLKEILIDRKIPRSERRWMPLLEQGGEVVWMHRVFGNQDMVRALTGESAVQ
jgi:tRNA(Ile)-lysidine synthase